MYQLSVTSLSIPTAGRLFEGEPCSAGARAESGRSAGLGASLPVLEVSEKRGRGNRSTDTYPLKLG